MKISIAGPLQMEGTAGGEALRQRAALVNLGANKEAGRLLSESGGAVGSEVGGPLGAPAVSSRRPRKREGVECLSGILGMQQALTSVQHHFWLPSSFSTNHKFFVSS